MIHALLIGPRRSGRSNIIQRLIQELNRPVFGYITKKEPDLNDEELGSPIYIYEPGKPWTQTPDNLMGYCKKHRFNTLEGAFNRQASRLLLPAPANGIIMFDEIGFMEASEQSFCDAIFSRLNGDIPVIAAVKDKEFPFLEAVKKHPKCRCFYVTQDNRETIYQEVLSYMKQNLRDEYRSCPVNSLSYFNAVLQSQPTDSTMKTAAKWDRRANAWKKDRDNNRKNDDRITSAIQFLEQRGILHENCDIVDIGCGPGRFVAAFAKKAHQVLGLDISEKMVEHGMEYIQEQGFKNASLRTCEFQSLDLEAEGYKGAFDLVFSSMTPAIHDMDSLKKSMEMSRQWCCNVSHLYRQNHLRSRIMKELFGKELEPQSKGLWFNSLFNLLFLMGYCPETSYENRHQEIRIEPDEEYVEYIMEHMLPPEERTTEHTERILTWMKQHADEDGTLLESSDSCYGTILWNVKQKYKNR